MGNNNLNTLIAAWIRFTRADRESAVRDELLWAYEEFARISEEEPDVCITLICQVLEKDSTMPVIGALAAGPMEDLLMNFGEDVIDRIEAIAKENNSFRLMLGGVWENDIPLDVWKRVANARDHAW